MQFGTALCIHVLHIFVGVLLWLSCTHNCECWLLRTLGDFVEFLALKLVQKEN